jgi:hypothetical protein
VNENEDKAEEEGKKDGGGREVEGKYFWSEDRGI